MNAVINGRDSQRQFGIASKIISGYAVVLIILVIIAATLLVNIRALVGQLSDVTEHDYVILEYMHDLEKLVVDMETGERGFLITGDETFLEPYDIAIANFSPEVDELMDLLAESPQLQALLVDIRDDVNTWNDEILAPYIAMRRDIRNGTTITENNTSDFNMLISTVAAGNGNAHLDAIRVSFDELLSSQQDITITAATEANQTVNMLQVLVISLSAVGIVFGVGVGVYLGRSISGNVRRVMVAARNVAEGDLEQRVTVTSNDEIERLADSFNIMAESLKHTMKSQIAKEYIEDVINNYLDFVVRVANGDLTAELELIETQNNDDLYELGDNLNSMVNNLRTMALQISENASNVSAAAAEILAASTQQIASATEQETAVTQTMTTVEEVRTTVRQTSERAQNVADVSKESVNVSINGQASVVDTVDGMKMIRQRVESIAENILMLSERTQQIGEIIETVNEIAAQSKLLALNASIEAARAGEEGKGFAVVAMEVRQLAEQSREATDRVRDILNQIQQATNTAVMVTEEGSKGAESGMMLVAKAGESIEALTSTIEQASQAAIQIAASTNQQNNGMEQLAQAMTAIKQASTQTAASTRQAERSAKDLNEMARKMQEAVSRYRLN